MKANQVVTNIAQDFTKTEKAQGRANIDAAEQKGFVECYRRFNDGTWTDTWFKICELSPGTSNNYSYGYELSLKFVCTNNGTGDCPAESATMNMGCNFIPALNVGRCEVAWADHTVDDHAQCAITGVKVLTHRASDNYGPRDKCEVWVKTSQYFTYYTQMRVEALVNAGNGCYRSNYSTPSMYILPWEFRNSMVTGTHTDPFNDANHPAASGYGAEGWSEVWYPCETKTVMVDHPQDFTEEEKAQARANIGVSGMSFVEFSNVLGGPDKSQANVDISLQRHNLPTVGTHYDMTVENEQGSTKTFALVPSDSPDGFIAMVSGHAQVMDIEVPPSVEMQTTMYDANNDGECNKMFKQWQLPMKNGKYPTRVIGSVAVCPELGRKVSLVPLAHYWSDTVWDADQQAWVPNPYSPEMTEGSQCHNYHYMLDGYDVSGHPNFTNQLSFAFHKTDTADLACIGLKGLSSESSIYNENFVVTCFWEK